MSNTALKYLRVWDGQLCLGTELREQDPGGGGDAMKIVECKPAHYAVQEVDQLGRANKKCRMPHAAEGPGLEARSYFVSSAFPRTPYARNPPSENSTSRQSGE